MKVFITVAALVAAAQASALQGVSSSLVKAAVQAKWSSFKAQHGKDYPSHEDTKRMENFLKATETIELHNARFHAGQESFEMGHNELSDLSLEEVMATRMGVKLPENFEEMHANVSIHVHSSGYAAPTAVDWAQKGGVQYVKNQGSCGSCYTFSAIGALETAQWRRNGQSRLPDLSEQQLVDCVGYGCSGGWMHDCYTWLRNNQGSCSQNDYRYTARVGQCQSASKTKVTRVASHTMIGRGDERALLDAVANVGTVAIAYNAGTQQHSNYRGGILDVPNCGNTPTHAVLLVGYGTENGKDFWRLKNSWGAGWGEQGYFRLARGKNMCGIADYASYPVAV